MARKKIAVLFGGKSSEYDVSLQSAYAVLQNIDSVKYYVVPIGITREGDWYHYTGSYHKIAENTWYQDIKNLQKVIVSPSCSDKGIWIFAGGKALLQNVDLVFPVLHGKNGEDGSGMRS